MKLIFIEIVTQLNEKNSLLYIYKKKNQLNGYMRLVKKRIQSGLIEKEFDFIIWKYPRHHQGPHNFEQNPMQLDQDIYRKEVYYSMKQNFSTNRKIPSKVYFCKLVSYYIMQFRLCCSWNLLCEITTNEDLSTVLTKKNYRKVK